MEGIASVNRSSDVRTGGGPVAKAVRATVAGVVLLVGAGFSSGVPRAFADADPAHPGVSGLSAEIWQDHGAPVYDLVQLSWTNPSTAAAPTFTGITVRGSSGPTGPQSQTAGFAVYSGTNTSVSTLQVQTPPAGGIVTYTVFTDYSDHAPVPVTTAALDGASVRFAPDPATITYGQAVVLRGQVRDAAHGTGISGANLSLTAAPAPNGTAMFLGYLTSDADGNFSRSLRPILGYTYTVFYPGDQGHIAGSVGPVALGVRPQVYITPGPEKPKHNKTFHISVSAGPQQYPHTVRLQRRTGGKWHTLQTLGTDPHGAAGFTVKEKKKGTYYYRADAVADPRYSEATSKTLTVKVN